MDPKYVMVSIYVLIHAFDAHSTYKAVKITGTNAVEANSLARWFMDRFGLLSGILISKIPFGIIHVLLIFTPLWFIVTLPLFVTMYMVWNNYKILKKYENNH